VKDCVIDDSAIEESGHPVIGESGHSATPARPFLDPSMRQH